MPVPLTDYWTGISAIIVAFVTCVVGPYFLALVNLKRKGITPQEAVHALDVVEFKHTINDSVALAIRIANAAQETASASEAETIAMRTDRDNLKIANDLLTNRVKALELAAAKLPSLELSLKRCQASMRKLRRGRK